MEREQVGWPGYLYNYRRTSNHPAGDSNTTTLGSVLNIEQTSSSRTLLDIIQADSTGESKNTWTYFREKLESTSTTLHSELQRADDSMNNPIPAEEEETQTGPMRMSLMALLAETDGLDKSGSGSGSRSALEDKNVVDEYTSNCIVCMMRHKGAAFIPCGHTFCRLCSKELYAQRGNCPLCNAYISEILHIF